eukprot:CAMPEP_0198125710 /NCGR_PEP_ID=MMETSP1442-20131203/43191_1 /TAXON_ID= /ORGANISM="Craspedostauros australis, Strain CCMP3328" /LENGTH=585 /DNA_ID=CAMNT_0043785367 /DNA_START=35 /DNA_END=1792 /DNA_ORIENTATION=-
MMMSKPAPEMTTEDTTPSFAIKPSEAPVNDVEDLERRLAMLGGVGGEGEATAPAPVQAPDLLTLRAPKEDSKPAAKAPPAAAAPASGGKSALLARIMAAQERTKQAQTKTEQPAAKQAAVTAPPTTQDLLMDLDAPNAIATPPPAFDTNLLPPPPPPAAVAPPPPFEAVHSVPMAPPMAPPPPIEALAPPPPSFEAVAPPPPMSAPSAPMMQPSAPSFDLLGGAGEIHPPPPPLDDVQAVPPPPPPMEMQIDNEVLAALDPEEREALLAEQRQIMEQIENDKVNSQASGAAARAMAFDQRSNTAAARAAGSMERPAPPARKSSSKKKKSKKSQRTIDLGAGEEVPLHGQERTKQAIKDGTAIMVQCVNCQNMMQVTGHATLMFCPVCQVVSPVLKQGEANAPGAAAGDSEDAQMDADAKLAQQLQNEEYKRAAGNGTSSSSSSSTRPATRQKAKPKQEDGKSWYDWLVGSSTEAPAASSNIGTMPDSAASRSTGTSGGLISAQTGTERSRSYDEDEGLLGGGSGGIGGGGIGGGARVAQQKGMFACVTDSIATATTAMYTDTEGNVHGVDSSSLLAMPQVSRQRD